MKRFIFTSALLLAALSCHAQTKINPNQVKWPTGSAGCVYTPGSNTCTALPTAGLAICADTSGSGTAQSCTTSPSFTPAANSCVLYTTTAANTGAGLTLNVNSLGAKSMAKWQSSTTLAAGDVAANKPVLACYDGTNWNLGTIGNAPGGAGNVSNSGTPTAGQDANWVDATHISGVVRPVQITASFVGVPASSQIILYVSASVAMTVPSSCSGSYMTALVAATASTAFLVKDLTTSTTLCTATFAISGTTATFSGSGGSISVGDQIEIIGPATADATLATIGANIYATR